MDGIVACFIGRLGGDAEMRYTQNGVAMLTFSAVALDGKAERDTPGEWVRVTCWKEQAEDLAPKLKKGSEVYVEGRLKLNTWQAQDGQQRSGLNLSAWTVQPIGQIGRRRPVAESANGLAGRRADREARRVPVGAAVERWPGEAG